MPYSLSDIFIGDFPITQDFGANPQIYEARYGLKGHNGTDFGCPTNTMVIASANGVVMETSFDAGGYGNYVKIKHDGYLTLYAHLNDYQVKVGDSVVLGQLIAHSNNTGNSTGPHLHFGVAPCDSNGNKTQMDNGYSGYINPMGDECQWTIKNPTAPVNTSEPVTDTMVEVPASEYPTIVAQGSDYKAIANFALDNGLNDFLNANKLGPIDLQQNPGDPEGGNKIIAYTSDLLYQIKDLKEQLNKVQSNNNEQNNTSTTETVQNLSTTQKNNLLVGIYNSIKGFIFE